MHSILFVIEYPETDDAHVRSCIEQCKRECRAFHSILAEGSELIQENMFLIPAKNGLRTLSSLVLIADRIGFAYRALFFDQAPQWVTSV